ncbi:MAG: hypothetical protein CO035_07525 [Candidatus Omnitrophica bacterium CG_4_9_14_0_2_um_filter_42_8]|nr:MAG: hypothetical protein COW92_03540 [Candidatus Omnitrophica bacterium CG22_combo_CG10-13_8_21_14_all_43_16]PJC47093.1 MAG: hypothetical protein CO035_07525 [Candidatus Omnitrophica bacterium CG_4_9_14_0_2_um_filter_42_8]
MKKQAVVFIVTIIFLFSLLWICVKFVHREKIPKSQLDSSLLLPVDPEQSRLINYEIYDGLLHKYVSDGLVDYIVWRTNDYAIFDKYIRSLKYVELDNLDSNQKKAFWINAYNGITIYAVLKRIPENRLLAKSFSVQAVPGFFDKIEYEVAGESLTLNDIENKKLRAGFGDPRVHFAIVCASRSCPEIQNTVFQPSGLDIRLDDAARDFIRDTKRNRIDKENGVLYLSEIFRWFEEDFVKDSGSAIGFVKKYINENDTAYLTHHPITVKYLFYNWMVNMRK